MTRVALLLDVDGVLIPYARPGEPPGSWPAASWRRLDLGFGYEATWSEAMVARIRGIADTPGVRPLWCTTWGPRAATRLGPAISMGTGWDSAVGVGGGAFATDGWWKAEAARQAVGENDAVVWIDDLIDAWREELARTGIPAPEFWPGGRLLTVSPAPERDLEPAQLDEVEEFVRAALAPRG